MTSDPWVHLPNAELIDQIIADFHNRHLIWRELHLMGPRQRLESRWINIEVAIWSKLCMVNGHRSTSTATNVCDNVIYALVVWPDCTHLLNCNTEQLKVMSALGIPAAEFILNAIPAIETMIKETI